MADARGAILNAVRGAIAARRSITPAVERPTTYIRPKRAQGQHMELLERFCEFARVAGASVARVAEYKAVPAAVARFMSREGLGDRLVMASTNRLFQLPWNETPRLSVLRSGYSPDDRAAMTEAIAGIAESGTLLVSSGQSPNALHLLPEAHIVAIDSGVIVGGYEDALETLGENYGDRENWPRAATFITGPSRTADIEKTPQIGVHGPRQLHIVVIDGKTPG